MSKRKIIIAGNWKMYKNLQESAELVNSLKKSLCGPADIEVVVCPPFTSLSHVRDLLTNSNIRLGAQDCFWEKEGAFTGEISPAMLKSAGCEYCIVGHSERRQYFGETNVTVNRKAKALLKEGIKPIVCVGEKLDERKSGRAFEVVRDHVVNSLAGIAGDDMLRTVIAYEPVWAIGTGANATKDEAQEVHKFIRGLVAEMYDKTTADTVRIQYGGSVKPDNIKELISQKDLDGALVGGASLKSDSFTQIVMNCRK